MSVRIFVESEELIEGPLRITGDEHHYLKNVRRQDIGARLCLLDGRGRMADAEITGIDEISTSLVVAAPEDVPPPAFSLTIAPALIKGDRMDQAISKMVELGVQRIVPMATSRTVVRLKGDRADSRHKRYESLCRAAARQSRNPNPTAVDSISSFESVLARLQTNELLLIPALGDAARPLRELLPDRVPGSATVLIGPEGGFSPEELERAIEAGFAPASLGPRVLRAETACIAMASILAFRYGDVGGI